MRQRNRLILGVIALSLACLLLGPVAVDYVRYLPSGAKEAQRDIQRGHLELRGYGLPARWVPEYARLLSSRLGVQYNPMAGCVVTSGLVRQTNEYNETMTREIERRNGVGILDKLADEASQVAKVGCAYSREYTPPTWLQLAGRPMKNSSPRRREERKVKSIHFLFFASLAPLR